MKGLIKRIGGKVFEFLIEKYEPKIQELDKPGLKKVLTFGLNWAKNIVEVLTDADPDDKKQLETVANELVTQAPEQFLEWAKVGLAQKQMDEEKKAFILDTLEIVIDELKQEVSGKG